MDYAAENYETLNTDETTESHETLNTDDITKSYETTDEKTDEKTDIYDSSFGEHIGLEIRTHKKAGLYAFYNIDGNGTKELIIAGGIVIIHFYT
ncbi:MAG: hypothetical protein HDR04_05685 [Lachnospiraceae bacterium]|nr:hypothetical protein [Lachnospiraceae bacterium]